MLLVSALSHLRMSQNAKPTSPSCGRVRTMSGEVRELRRRVWPISGAIGQVCVTLVDARVQPISRRVGLQTFRATRSSRTARPRQLKQPAPGLPQPRRANAMGRNPAPPEHRLDAALPMATRLWTHSGRRSRVSLCNEARSCADRASLIEQNAAAPCDAVVCLMSTPSVPQHWVPCTG